jgi:uncharacterized membrane protein
MDVFAKPDKKSLKIYFLIISLVFVALVLVVNFQIFPVIFQEMNAISTQESLDMENKFYFGSIGFLIFIFLINISFWMIDNKLTKQEQEIKKNLDANPDDSVLKYELKRMEKKIKLFFSLSQLIFFIGIGAALGFLIFYVILPVYSLSFTI